MTRPDTTSVIPPPAERLLPAPPSGPGPAPAPAPVPLTGPRWRRLWAVAERDALDAGFSRGWGRAVFWLPTVGGVLIGATVVSKPVFYWILSEDHLVEWLQFTLLAFTAMAAAIGAVRMARQGQWAAAALYVLFALAATALAGEEVSWGQRVFGFAPPPSLAAVNDQREVNLHNVALGGLDVDALSDYVSSLQSVVLLVLSLAVRLPRAAAGRSVRPIDRGPLRVLCPPLVLVPSLVFSAAYSWAQLVPGVSSLGAFWKFEEWAELCRYLALAVLAAEFAARYARRPLSSRRTAARHAQPPTRPDLGEPVLAGSATAGATLTVVFAVLSARNGVKIVHVPH